MILDLIAILLISISGFVVGKLLREKRVPGAVARSGAITTVKHKSNSPTDLYLKRREEKRQKFKSYKYSKRNKKKLARLNGIQTIPTKSSGDELVPKSSFIQGVNL